MRIFLLTCLAVLFVTPAEIHAQSALQLGGGYTHTPDGSLGAGANALASIQVASPWRALRLRIDGFGSTSRAYGLDGASFDKALIGTHSILGLGAGVQLERSGGAVHPYVFAALNQYGEWSPSRSFRLVPGVAGGVGASAQWKGREWFAELSGRSFGERIFSDESRTTVILPLSVGLRF